MDLKKFKHDLKNENLVIPSMSDKLKNYSKQEVVYKEKKEKIRISLQPLLRYSYLLIPILIMLIVVTVCSTSFSLNNYNYQLYSVKNKNDLQEIINYNNNVFEMDILDSINGPLTDGSKGDAWENDYLEGTVNPNPGETNSSPNYSETNTQEQGVDESDIVKTDGRNIYYYNLFSCTLTRYDTQTQEMLQIQLEKFQENEMYVTDKYVVLLNTRNQYNESNTVKVNVYNKDSLEIVTNYIGHGIYIDSRLMNNTLYLIYTQFDTEEMPSDVINFEENVYDYCDIKYSPAIINKRITYIMAMDLDTLETNVHLQLGAHTWQAVYMTENSLYLALSTYCSSFANYTLIGTRYISSLYQTNILVFDINKTSIDYKGVIITSGLINDQFYMDEYDNHLRIVLQQQNTAQTGNNKLEVYALDKYQANGLLKKVASIDDGIGKTGEQIKSVRFSDNSCLIVTYLRTDPLYYIDLTNQLKPVIVAGYEEPGYNTYLHYINDELAIGFGIVSSYYKLGLYTLENGIPNKVDEKEYRWLSVFENHKALYIEGDVFGFGGRSGKYEIYDVYTIDYENDVPKLKLIKQINNKDSYVNFENHYERMIRIGKTYYLITKYSIEIYDSNFELQNEIITFDITSYK